MKKILIAGFLFLLILASSVSLQFFLIGTPVDGNTTPIDVTEDGNILYIHVMSAEPASAYCGERRQLDESTLYIDLRKVLVSPIHDSGYHLIAVEKNDMTSIIVGGKQVWSVD